MHALARLRGQMARLRERTDARVADALDLAELALGLVEDVRLECAALQQRCAEAERQARNAEAETRTLLDLAPLPLVTTDSCGMIVDANRAAARLLGRSAPKLRNELLLHFFDDRAAFTALLRNLPTVLDPQPARLQLRPRERAPLIVEITRARDPRSGDDRWLWFLARLSAPPDAVRTTVHRSPEEPSSPPAES